jgi:uncharacterized membrane protein YedE/YeeE
MEISQSALARLYWYALLLGVGLGAFYDALRITRVFLGVHYSRGTARKLEQIDLPLLGTRKRRRESRCLGVVTFFEDLLFCILAGVALILLFYVQNNGKVRFPVFFCAAAGFLLYRATLGRLVMPFLEAIAFGIEVAVRYFWLCVSWPIRWITGWICARVRRIWEKTKLAHRKRLRHRYTEAQMCRVGQDAGGMIPERMEENRNEKRRGRSLGRTGKSKKAVQSNVAGASAHRHSGSGVPGGIRK